MVELAKGNYANINTFTFPRYTIRGQVASGNNTTLNPKQ